jgi:hypothetical protein
MPPDRSCPLPPGAPAAHAACLPVAARPPRAPRAGHRAAAARPQRTPPPSRRRCAWAARRRPGRSGAGADDLPLASIWEPVTARRRLPGVAAQDDLGMPAPAPRCRAVRVRDGAIGVSAAQAHPQGLRPAGRAPVEQGAVVVARDRQDRVRLQARDGFGRQVGREGGAARAGRPAPPGGPLRGPRRRPRSRRRGRCVRRSTRPCEAGADRPAGEPCLVRHRPAPSDRLVQGSRPRPSCARPGCPEREEAPNEPCDPSGALRSVVLHLVIAHVLALNVDTSIADLQETATHVDGCVQPIRRDPGCTNASFRPPSLFSALLAG